MTRVQAGAGACEDQRDEWSGPICREQRRENGEGADLESTFKATWKPLKICQMDPSLCTLERRFLVHSATLKAHPAWPPSSHETWP